RVADDVLVVRSLEVPGALDQKRGVERARAGQALLPADAELVIVGLLVVEPVVDSERERTRKNLVQRRRQRPRVGARDVSGRNVWGVGRAAAAAEVEPLVIAAGRRAEHAEPLRVVSDAEVRRESRLAELLIGGDGRESRRERVAENLLAILREDR